MAGSVQINYRAVPTARRFHRSDAFVRAVRGPVRSGKSSMMTNEIFRLMTDQWPQADGVRRSRGLVVRNTYREILDTTVKTWLDWWPEAYFGPFNHNHMSHVMKFNGVECEVLFRALDRPADIKKLLSLEVSWAWLNEVREIPFSIVEAAMDRVGQFPAKKDGGCKRPCLIMDTNSPDDDSWYYALETRDQETADNIGLTLAGIDGLWDFFIQPGALIESGDGVFVANPEAENIEHLNEGVDYYLKRVPGRKKDYVRVYYCNRFGFVVDGKPVHSDYHDEVHCAKEPIEFVDQYVLYAGLDFGLTPAAALGQRYPNGRWVGIDELVTEDMGAARFAAQLAAMLSREPYVRAKEIRLYGDPAGDDRVQTDERTVYQILHANGITATPCHTNDTTIRRESLGRLLRGMLDGKPAFLLSPRCKILRKGLAGGFCYKRVQVAGKERYQDKPDKNRFSHPVEALEYMLLGGGEGRSLVTPANAPPLPEFASAEYDDGF